MSSFPIISGSKGHSGITGGDWKCRVYYDPEADTEGVDKIEYQINKEGHHTAKQKMENLFDDDIIVKIEAYKTPLHQAQHMQNLLYHEFIVIKTQGEWWWSIEKNTEEIAVQRSKQKGLVKDRLRRNKRNTPIDLIKEQDLPNHPKLSDLVQWMWESDQTTKTYHVVFKNCKDFAEGLYEAITKFEQV